MYLVKSYVWLSSNSSLNIAVLWYKWGALLYTSNSWAGRCWLSSFKPGPRFYFCVFSYQQRDNLVDVTLYSCGHEAHGYIWQKVCIFLLSFIVGFYLNGKICFNRWMYPGDDFLMVILFPLHIFPVCSLLENFAI